MSIVSEKKFLIEEELQTLQKIQSQTRALIAELGEIELIKLYDRICRRIFIYNISFT